MQTLHQLKESLPKLVGATVPKPVGTLAGHAAGLPFEALVHGEVSAIFPGRAFRHFEFLNQVLWDLNDSDLNARLNAFGPKSMQSLLVRGKAPMSVWKPEALFEEKQNDTAESVIVPMMPFDPGNGVTLLDVKTHNNKKNGQPPNIMSAGKLAEALALSIEEGAVLFDVVYVGIGWEVFKETLVCTNLDVVSLFKMPPNPYINWASAEQLQFHVRGAEQTFEGTREDWAKAFLSHFVVSLEGRIETQNKRLSRFKTLST